MQVKIWYIPEKGLEQSLSTAECQFSHKQRRVETVGFHPTADYLLHSTAAGSVNLWDLSVQKEAFGSNEHPDIIQSLSWKHDGTLLATSCKDKMVRIMDPRSNVPITMCADSHQSIKDSRVVWLGDQQRILTTGFDAARLRQIIIRDLRNFGAAEKTLELDCSTGILMPLYDADTNMLFLAGKGDTTIAYMEVTDKDPYLIEGLRHNGEFMQQISLSFTQHFRFLSTGEQTKGACLVPKRALRVMEGEVNRIMQLTSNSVIPIMYQVPRKTYRDFHSDLYPETSGYKTDLTVTQWLKGVNLPVPKISLDPAKRELGDAPIIVSNGSSIFLHQLSLRQISFIYFQTFFNPKNPPFSSQIYNISFLIPFIALISCAKIQRGTLSEMIKNETNRLVKQPKPLSTTTTPASIHQKSPLISNDPIAIRKSNTDKNAVPALSKLDIIKKFDNKTKESSPVQSVATLAKIPHEEFKSVDKHDEDERAHSSNSDEFDNESGNQSDNNNSYKNGHGNGNNNSGAVPPKPLPRTSRNNSISSISSDQGAALSIATVIDDTVGGVRPVAKPRTTTASYKVAPFVPSSTRAHY